MKFLVFVKPFIFSDILALRFIAGNTITVGAYDRIRDIAAWVLPFWEESMEYYPNVLAL